MTIQKEVSHIPTYHIGLHAQLVRRLSNESKGLGVEVIQYLFFANIHSLKYCSLLK